MNVRARRVVPPEMSRRRAVGARRGDFGAGTRERWSGWRFDTLRGPYAASPAGTPSPRSGAQREFRRGSGSGAHRPGQLPPRQEPGKRPREVQDDPAHRALDPDGKLDQPLPQGADLGVGARGAPGPAPQLLEQDVGGEREEDPELVGPKPRATGPAHLQPVMQLFEAVLHVP